MFSGSLVALVTPMSASGAVDYQALGGLLDFHLSRGTDGIVVGGTTGESATLRPEELGKLVAETRAVVGTRVPVIAGSGSNDTAQAVALTERVCAAGADACLVVTPYYNRPTQAGLYAHYLAVADAASAPVILYNVPSRTGCDLLPQTVIRLAAHANIRGLKEAVADPARVAEVLAGCTGRIEVYSGDDAATLAMIEAGACGVISVSANVAPDAMRRLCALALGGDLAAARELDARLQPLHRALFVEPNPIPVKFALAHRGLIARGIRLPLTWLEPGHESVVVQALQEFS